MDGGCYTETVVFTCMYSVTDCEAIGNEKMMFRSVLQSKSVKKVKDWAILYSVS